MGTTGERPEPRDRQQHQSPDQYIRDLKNTPKYSLIRWLIQWVAKMIQIDISGYAKLSTVFTYGSMLVQDAGARPRKLGCFQRPGVHMGTRLEPPATCLQALWGLKASSIPTCHLQIGVRKPINPLHLGLRPGKWPACARAGERIQLATLSNWNMTGIFIRQRQTSEEDRYTFTGTLILHKQS